MSDEDKRRLPVQGMFDYLEAGADDDVVSVCMELLDSAKNLSSETNIVDVDALTLFDTLIAYANANGYTEAATVLQNYVKSYRENCRSRNGWLVEKVIKPILSAVGVRSVGDDEDDLSRKNRFFGGGRR